jgi:hypothetical protein
VEWLPVKGCGVSSMARYRCPAFHVQVTLLRGSGVASLYLKERLRHRACTLAQPTTYLNSHPVCRRPTHRGAGAVPGVQVERATVRTTWTPGAVSARLCLGRWQTGWEFPTATPHGRHPPAVPPPSRSLSAPAGGMSFTAVTVMRYSPCSPALFCRGRASAQRARSGPKAGAQRDAEPGARPAERSAAGLEDVEKVVTQRR